MKILPIFFGSSTNTHTFGDFAKRIQWASETAVLVPDLPPWEETAGSAREEHLPGVVQRGLNMGF